jgi:hypothetical protein
MLPYARLLTRLSGTDASGPRMASARPARQAPNTGNDAGWAVRHSLWLLPALLFGGFGAWLSFGYIALRHQRWPWLGAAAAYLILSIAAFGLTVVGPVNATGPVGIVNDIGICLLFVLWPAAIMHVMWVNFTSRLPLLKTSSW